MFSVTESVWVTGVTFNATLFTKQIPADNTKMVNKLYNNDLLLLLEFLRAEMSICHIDCSCPTCADDVALLAKFFLCLQLPVIVVKFFICREHNFIGAQKSAEVLHLHRYAKLSHLTVFSGAQERDLKRKKSR